MKKSVLVGFFLVAASLVLFTGNDAAAQGATDDPAQVDAGQAVYSASCARCHGASGEGVTGLGRPLTDIASQGDRARHVASVTDGRGGMPAFGDSLEADEIDSAISFVRLTFVSADDAATDDSAAAAETTELAVTGAETPIVALAGLSMVTAGGLLVAASRRRLSK